MIIQVLKNQSRKIVHRFRATEYYARRFLARDLGYSREPIRETSTVVESRKYIPYQLLLCAPGSGNIGDQAMFEAFVRSQSSHVVAIVPSKNSVSLRDIDVDSVTLIELPSLYYKAGRKRQNDVRLFTSLVRNSASYNVIGADVMDGVYNSRSSLSRISTLLIAEQFKVNTNILGFSWSDKSKPGLKYAMRRLNQSTILNARDPRSLGRLESLGLAATVRQVADIVFSDSTMAQESSELPSEKYVLLNASGLIDSQGQVQQYGYLVSYCHQIGLKVVMLPHVIRPGADDLPVCKAIYDEYCTPDDVLISNLKTPNQVRELTARATFVVTGRMHLAIMSLSMGTPAFTLSTVGKVEGLYDLFELPDLILQPDSEFAQKVIPKIDELSTLRAVIKKRLPTVIQLSKKNHP